MKHNKKLAFPIFLAMSMALAVLSGCTIGKLDPSSPATSSENQSENASSQDGSQGASSQDGSSQGGSSEGGSSDGGSSEGGSSEGGGGGGGDTTKTITIYASNDMHGAIESASDRSGLKAWGTFGKEKGAEPNTLLLDQGDTWQGSLYSNMNKGNVIQDIMCYMEYDARTVGNHDFDWGLEAVRANSARTFTYGGKTYSVPTLAANVYDYNFSTKQFGTTQQSDIGGKTVSYTLDNGLTVGIVGLIGSDQITSINSLYTHDIGFKDHIQTIKDEATNLRNAGCDIVICCIHAGIQKNLANESQYLTNKGLGGYVDLLLGAHSHQEESYVDNGYPDVHMYQFASYTEMFGKITLTYDTDLHKVTNTEMEQLTASYIKEQVGTDYDPVIASLVDNNKTTCDVEGSVVLANNVMNLPHISYDIEYVVDSYDSAIYHKEAGEWVREKYLSSNHDPNNPNWYFVNGINESDCVNGNYYLDLNSDCGNYYYFSSGELHEVDSVTHGVADVNWARGNCHSVNFDTTNYGPNLMAKAVFDRAIDEGYTDIVLSYVNQSRAALTGNSWTWADIYEAFPFDNTVYIIEVTGNEILNEIKRYNNVCFNPSFNKQINVNNKYKIACLDYLTFHTNSNRYYDYFPDNNGEYLGALSENYREILKDWLIDNGYNSGKRLSLGDYYSGIDQFNRDTFVNVTKCNATFKMNDGTNDDYASYSLSYDLNLRYNLPTPDPERTGYVFGGWYLNPECTGINVSTSNYYIHTDVVLYAKWTSSALDIYETGRLDYNTFQVDSNISYASATCEPKTPVLVTFQHSPIVDKTYYSQFGIPNNGYIFAYVPNGYQIATVEISQYSNHPENLNFYAGVDKTGTELYKAYTSGSNSVTYNIEVNSSQLYIAELNDTYTTSINYIALTVVYVGS